MEHGLLSTSVLSFGYGDLHSRTITDGTARKLDVSIRDIIVSASVVLDYHGTIHALVDGLGTEHHGLYFATGLIIPACFLETGPVMRVVLLTKLGGG